MKNKIVFIGSLCAILALGLVFAGCDAEAQLVKIEYSKLASPGNVTASIVTVTENYDGDTYTYKAVEVKWDAVDGATGYNIVATQDGKKTVYTIETYTGSPVRDNTGKIIDLDKWSTTTETYRFSKGTWKIGVVANTNGYGKEPSDPAWASAVTID